MIWSDVPLDTRERLLKQYEAGESLNGQADFLGMKLQTLKRRLRDHRLYTAMAYGENPKPAIHLPELVPGPVSHYKSPSPLTDIELIDTTTDQGPWLQRLHYLYDNEPEIAVMHLCDIHYPFHNTPGLDLAYQLVEHVQPHVIVVGSDAADFSIISSFPKDPDVVEEGDDVLQTFEEFWNPHIHELRRRAPNATLVYILGNHDVRIYKFIMAMAPQVRRTIWAAFERIIRCGGAVKWIGETDQVRLGPLTVMHGNRINIHAAKALLEDAAYQTCISAGHVHRLTSWVKRGPDYQITGITSGCLCGYTAHYMKHKTPTTRQQMGTAVNYVNLRGREVHQDNILFEVDLDRVHCLYERKRFSYALQREPGLVTYEEWLESIKTA